MYKHYKKDFLNQFHNFKLINSITPTTSHLTFFVGVKYAQRTIFGQRVTFTQRHFCPKTFFAQVITFLFIFLPSLLPLAFTLDWFLLLFLTFILTCKNDLSCKGDSFCLCAKVTLHDKVSLCGKVSLHI